ncbi:hypothetical protein DO97_01565 [Neosynechococcus sphagnicola sy1]|uniref:NAD-dependent epimerase/dehydratase domain-containing protein n=1 Tax=Neosynechococcus sphagnicola sy1 TaxID=1497020 RepID=A0A098TMW4_9CYAN|nr:NAD(P)-dependent oxidoreductase [Neosynechococcus sphagnicola]KGF73217.1 hypothetical protein DO97_01565 [Neosynechococcus sphagnicola sy1]
MKVLITGALGYIGGQLVEQLRQRSDCQLRLLVRRDPLELQAWVSGLEVWQGDLTQPQTLRGIGDGIDRVIHLAALDAPSCQRDPVAALRVNVEGTLNLWAAVGSAPAQLIYLSTFHVYGANGRDRVTEETPLAPIHPYGSTHGMAELYTTMYARQRQQGATILRLSNSYGPPLTPDVNCWTIVINDLCRQAIAQQRLVLRSSGLQVRDFIALRDVVAAIEQVMRQPAPEIQTLNLGGLKTYSILEVAQAVQGIYQTDYGRHLPLERPQPLPQETPGSLDFRCDRLQAWGWRPHISLTDNIRQTLRFCQQHFSPRQES